MSDGVEKRLETGIYGKTQFKPEETKKFLGNFRERIYVAMSVFEMNQEAYQQGLQSRIKEGFSEEVSLYLNANIGETMQSTYLKIARQFDLPFTLYTTNEEVQKETIGLVIAAKVAVNVEKINIADLCSLKPEKSLPKKEKGFLSRLFS